MGVKFNYVVHAVRLCIQVHYYNAIHNVKYQNVITKVTKSARFQS